MQDHNNREGDARSNGAASNNGADWWREMLSRRQAGVRIARLAAGSMMLPALATIVGCSGDEEETLEDVDALSMQKSDGWNVGSESKPLKVVHATQTDSQQSDEWKQRRASDKLLASWGVRDSRWQPFVVPTLAQSLAQASLAKDITPVHNTKMDEAYRRGLGMREIILKAKNPEQMVIVAELPGPESVAFAAALADVADPVLTFDNWPHPDGVVKAEQTLGALLYYAAEVEKKAADRLKAAANGSATRLVPAVFMLDSDRLDAPASGAADEFDNRYMAKIPEAANLKSARVDNVFYAVADATVATELDDLNEPFASYRESGVTVSKIPLSDFRADETLATADSTSAGRGSTGHYGRSHYHSPYYYGGGLMMLPLFFHSYPGMAYGAGPLPPASRFSGARVSRPGYVPTRRSTVFSSRTTGGASGVGRTRPSGFGRVSRATSGGGSFGGRRSSGSYGRARGGSGM